MDLSFACPQCGASNRVSGVERSTVLACDHCDYVGVLPTDWRREGRVDLCPMCGSEDLYGRRDYRPWLIALALAAGALLAPRTRFLSLLFAAAAVGLHILRAQEHLFCYRCGSRISGHHPPGQHGRFDPETAARAQTPREPNGDHSSTPR